MRQPDGSVVLDAEGTRMGRGAYLCADPACWALAAKRRALERALRIALPPELKTRLEHADVGSFRAATEHGAPETMTGGTHGT